MFSKGSRFDHGMAPSLIKATQKVLNEKKNYQEVFAAALDKFGIDSPKDLKSDKETKEFFKYVDSQWKAKNEEIQTEESGDKEAYQKFFQAALKKFGAKSPASLDDAKKKEFFNYIEKNWTGDTQNESKRALKKWGVKSISDIDDDKKGEFYRYVDTQWLSGKNESINEGQNGPIDDVGTFEVATDPKELAFLEELATILRTLTAEDGTSNKRSFYRLMILKKCARLAISPTPYLAAEKPMSTVSESRSSVKLSPEATKLLLYLENDDALYRRQYLPILKNLTAKKASGKYDSNLAVKEFMHLVTAALKKYAQDFDEIGFDNPAEKKAALISVATELKNNFEDEYELGNYDSFIPKKYRTIKESYTNERSKAASQCRRESALRAAAIRKYKKNGDSELSEEDIRQLKEILKTSDLKGYITQMKEGDDPGEIFIRARKKSEVNRTPNMRALAQLSQFTPQGMEVVYKPFGAKGRGYYYIKKETR